MLNREVVRYLGKLITDYQFDRKSSGYLGFINTDPSDSDEDTPYALELVKNYKLYISLLKSVGIMFAGEPNNEELILSEIN